MYKVIKCFTDLQDNHYVYHVGDTFPRDGVETSKSRLTELSTANNKRGIALIEEIPEIVAEQDIYEEHAEEVKEEPQEEKVDVDPPKKSKTKKSTKKA